MAAGHVYLLVNASNPGLLKIGKTERTPEDRARELSTGSGVPSPFMVAYSEDVPDCAKAERLIHKRLDKFRPNKNREFFQLPLKDAIIELSRIAEDVRRSTPPVVPVVPVSVAEPSAPLAVTNTPTGEPTPASGPRSPDGGCGGVVLGVVILVIFAVVVRFVWLRAVVPVYEVIASLRTNFWVFMGTMILVVMLWVVVLMWGWGAIKNKRRASK